MKYNKQEKSDWLHDPSAAARTVTCEGIIDSSRRVSQLAQKMVQELNSG